MMNCRGGGSGGGGSGSHAHDHAMICSIQSIRIPVMQPYRPYGVFDMQSLTRHCRAV